MSDIVTYKEELRPNMDFNELASKLTMLVTTLRNGNVVSVDVDALKEENIIKIEVLSKR